MKKINPAPKLVSLFSGCGGMDLGFRKAGYELAWANDFDKDACLTYRRNLGDIVEGDVTAMPIPDIDDVDVLTSGFPCQPFSNSGLRMGVRDPRGRLFENTIEFIGKLKPKAVVIENVRGLLSTKIDEVNLIDVLHGRLRDFGYHSGHKLLNLSHFGVPQNRIRVIVIAVRDEASLERSFPGIVLDRDLTLRATLAGLTDAHSNQADRKRLNPQALHYGAMIPPGGSWKSIPYDLLPDRWKRIRDNMERYHYPNFFRRYAPDEISGTVTATFKPEHAGVWHPVENRVLSVREVARIQSFPDDFAFVGRTVDSNYKQIGNAVPPAFSFLVADALRPYLGLPRVAPSLTVPFETEALNVNRSLADQKPRTLERLAALRSAEAVAPPEMAA